jgi:hypothetical protein
VRHAIAADESDTADHRQITVSPPPKRVNSVAFL